jgi:hypothetical protein
MLPADHRLATVRAANTRTGLEICPDEIPAVTLDLWSRDVVDDLEDVPDAVNDGQLDCDDHHEDEKEVHVGDFTDLAGLGRVAAISSKRVIEMKPWKRSTISSPLSARTRSVPKFSTLKLAIVDP